VNPAGWRIPLLAALVAAAAYAGYKLA